MYKSLWISFAICGYVLNLINTCIYRRGLLIPVGLMLDYFIRVLFLAFMVIRRGD